MLQPARVRNAPGCSRRPLPEYEHDFWWTVSISISSVLPSSAINSMRTTTGVRTGGALDRVKQIERRVRVVGRGFRETLGQDHAAWIDREMQLAPATAALGAVFGSSPFALAEGSQPAAVDQQMDWAPVGDGTQVERKALAAARQCGVIGRLEDQAHDPQNRAKEALGLPERQMKHDAERQRRFDGHVGELGLRASAPR